MFVKYFHGSLVTRCLATILSRFVKLLLLKKKNFSPHHSLVKFIGVQFRTASKNFRKIITDAIEDWTPETKLQISEVSGNSGCHYFHFPTISSKKNFYSHAHFLFFN